MRNCRGAKSVRRSMVSRQRSGAMKGISPSMTHTRARARNRSAHITRCHSLTGALRDCRIEIFEQLAFGFQEQEIPLAYVLPVDLQAAVESIEIGIFLIRLGIDFSGLGIAPTTNGLRLLVGVREQHGACAFGIGTNFLCGGLTLRPQLKDHFLACRTHTLI